jgi:hypothetical protein
MATSTHLERFRAATLRAEYLRREAAAAEQVALEAYQAACREAHRRDDTVVVFGGPFDSPRQRDAGIRALLGAALGPKKGPEED